MDGNGRWAKARHLPRTAGHMRGVQSVRRTVQACGEAGVQYLTLFAFSSENWRRPQEEVGVLMKLFMQALEREVTQLDSQGVRLRVIGDISKFEPRLIQSIHNAEKRTEHNNQLHLTIAASYGGRWDILQAIEKSFQENPGVRDGSVPLSEDLLASHLSMAWAPEPDLFIRTGGEQRISNFLIWQLAYTELYFSDRHWPEFDEKDLQTAFDWYANRERRFGRTSEQLAELSSTGRF
ncbi:polyprenyl diphosphate synthase [Orrella marina]|uniref:Isoprenyl transferase n=1 Tax=Orrella marina TaxID=2163011 RepID=A0A2R4XPD0_9BURK|nr:polyprenyl diphosphate synthase [Orrella marina]AWB35650.1 di-trans,poly-cis-decaprenylcistransferase [Orrella marina]